VLKINKNKAKVGKAPTPEDVLQWIRRRRKRLKAKKARLGELAGVGLEEEFES